MPGFRILLRCVGEAVVARGLRALVGLVPFGEQFYDIAGAAFCRYRSHCQEEQMRAEIQAAMQAGTTEVSAAVDAVVAEVQADASPEVRIELTKPEVLDALKRYLTQVPGNIRKSLRRPSDPSDTIPPTRFVPQRPMDMLRLLPARLARFRPGDQPVSNWVLTELLGIGGFGEVWKGDHPSLKGIPPVALKFCLDPVATRELRHEAALLSMAMQQSQHQGVVALRNAWLENEPVCLEYEYVSGGDLAGLPDDWKQLPTEQRVRQAALVIQELATTMRHFHRLTPPIVHRDLKPANILVQRAPDGRQPLRITDFGIGGIAAEREIAQSRKGISQGDILSAGFRGAYTPLYASPQQMRGDSPDPRDDVHALGIIWYQLLTGELCQGPGVDFSDELRDLGVSEGIIGLLGKCIASNPGRRLADAGVLSEEIAARLAEQAALTCPAQPVAQSRKPSSPEVGASIRKAKVDAKECEQLLRLGKESGDYIKKVWATRINAWRVAAEEGVAAGQWLMAMCYEEGCGVPKNPADAFRWYEKAAEQGQLWAQQRLGEQLAEGQGVAQNRAEAARWYSKAAEQGHSGAQRCIGQMYEEGQGVAQDYAEAARWYTKAAEQGNPAAQFLLGWLYEEGRGVAQDYAEAAAWYNKAAEQGNPEAQCWLGHLYEEGRGVAQNYPEAVRWYGTAAEQGHPWAQRTLGWLYATGQGGAQDSAKAAQWFRKAAEQGDATAQVQLSAAYLTECGVPQDDVEAVRWLRKAAEQGNAEGMYTLGLMCREGRGVPQDSSEAQRWFGEAAKEGHSEAEAQYKFGMLVDFDIYCAGIVARVNPEPNTRSWEWDLGGTWAWCFVKDGTGFRSGSGSFSPRDIGMDRSDKSNKNLAELVAAVRALESAPPYWCGRLFTANKLTHSRLLLALASMRGVPTPLITPAHALRHRFPAGRIILLDSHPTKKHLVCGTGKRGLPVSEFRLVCEKMCDEQAQKLLREQGVL